jgi:hypothetical protein
MKPPDSERPGASDADDTGRGIFEVRARRAARWALIASLVLMACIVVFMLARGEPIPAEAWFVAVVWAGWVMYTLRAMDREKRP